MRVVNIRKKPCTHSILRGSSFGNIFSHLEQTTALIQVKTKQEAVDAFRGWLLKYPSYLNTFPTIRQLMLEDIKNLPEDAILGCTCNRPPCHGYVIVEVWTMMR